MHLADHYEAHFRALSPKWEQGFLEQRRQALQALLRDGLPSRKQEEWRFTDPSPIVNCAFNPVVPGPTRTATAQDAQAYVLMFVDGTPCVTQQSLPEGVILQAWRDSPEALPDSVRGCFDVAGDDGFMLMNTAFLAGGACLYVPPGCKLAAPIHLNYQFTSDASSRAYHLRNILVLGEGAEAEVVEHYHYPGQGTDMTADLCNVVTRVALAPAARLEHCQLTACGRVSALLSLQAEQQADSCYHVHALGAGTTLGRQAFRVRLCGAAAAVELDCLYHLNSDEHLECRMLVEHAVPNTRSLQLFRGMVGGRAHGVFNGRVRIQQGAQDTDARQDSAGLLLSEQARVDICPMLEIYADAVRCSHGATVGHLDEDAVFYMRSRLLSRSEAEALLRRAFALTVLERLPVASRALLHRIGWEVQHDH